MKAILWLSVSLIGCAGGNTSPQAPLTAPPATAPASPSSSAGMPPSPEPSPSATSTIDKAPALSASTSPTPTSTPRIVTNPIACKTQDDCWMDEAFEPAPRPKTLRGKRPAACKGTEHTPDCKDGVCIVVHWKC